MCDTLVATPTATANGEMILAKNSDREPNEAQNITFVPARSHKPGQYVRCTYVSVSQVRRTHAALISRPFWMGGAEMGVNEHGVAIGNEAVFTNQKYEKIGLTGMDLVRLALERADSADRAVSCITDLIRIYGQGGDGGFQKPLYYHNSFLIADPGRAYILETAGSHWAVSEVRGTAGISNRLSIGADAYALSPGLEKGLDFSRQFSDRVYTYFAGGKARRRLSRRLLAQDVGNIRSLDMMTMLRTHHRPGFWEGRVKPMRGLCLHAGGPISSQTTGSMVAVLRPGARPLVYFTGTAAPCISVFLPHTLAQGQKKPPRTPWANANQDGSTDLYGSASGTCDNHSLWWAGERIHRRALREGRLMVDGLKKERNSLERAMLDKVEKNWAPRPSAELGTLCAAQARKLAQGVFDRAQQPGRPALPPFPGWFNWHWTQINKKAGFSQGQD